MTIWDDVESDVTVEGPEVRYLRNKVAELTIQLTEARERSKSLEDAMHKLLNVCESPAHDSYTIYRAAERANAVLAQSVTKGDE